jgi:archaellum biogenesis ATPase FlaH/5S rRNA maturation endonuclease (ribonuclease M5)
MENVKDIKARAIEIYRHYLPDISARKNILCPFHDDKKTKSFALYGNANDLKFKCFGCGKQGDVINFIQEKEDYTNLGDAIKRAKEILGLNSNSHKEKTLTMQEIKEFKPDGYMFQRMHTYKAGGPEYIKTIYKDPEGNKQARYFTLIDNNKGLYLPERKSKPVLYNQDLLAQKPNDVVCYVEGEKDCDTLTRLGFLAVTAGSATDFNSYMAHHKAEHFKGCDVVLFPDHDQAGYESVKRIAEVLSPVAKSIKQVNLEKAWDKALPSGMPQGADITDFIDQYKELYNDDIKEVIRKMIKDAESIKIEKKSLLDSLLKWNDVAILDVKTEYLLENLIPKGSITLLFGRGGVGKTSLSLQIAHKVAEGLPFGELQTIKTSVYFIDFENPLSILKERVEKIGQADNLWVWHLSNNPMPPRLDSPQFELYKQLPAGLLIFDTLRASHLSDENNSQDMAVIIARLKELREGGFTILLLHHTPKSNEGIYKGSTALLDLIDHCLSIENVKNAEGEPIEFDSDNLYRLGVRIKTRYDPHHLFLKFNPNIKGFEVAKDPDYEVIEAIHELLADKNELNTNQVYELVKKELDIKNKVQVLKLLKKGEGKFWDTEKRGRAVYYRFKSLDLYIDKTIKPMDKNGLEISNQNTNQNLDNTVKFNGLNDIQTDKPIFIDTEVEL